MVLTGSTFSAPSMRKAQNQTQVPSVQGASAISGNAMMGLGKR
jgi:hypothetical protein